MGGAFGSIASAVGKGGSLLGGIGDAVGKGAHKVADSATGKLNTVEGTGQTVGDLKDMGYSNDQIGEMGEVNPNPWAKIGKGALLGGLRGNQNQPQQPQAQAVPIQGEQPQLPSDFFQPSTLYADARKRFNPFYGG